MNQKRENHIIRGGIIVFWWLFWLLNVVDKAFTEGTFLWLGKDRITQFVGYFSSIGVTNPAVASSFLVFITILEFIALYFLTLALLHFFLDNTKKAHKSLFYGILVSLGIFSFFTMGDQIFGDRFELLEHTLYWIALVISWYIYTRSEK